jgi:hypothetical protein
MAGSLRERFVEEQSQEETDEREEKHPEQEVVLLGAIGWALLTGRWKT